LFTQVGKKVAPAEKNTRIQNRRIGLFSGQMENVPEKENQRIQTGKRWIKFRGTGFDRAGNHIATTEQTGKGG
jgi:hypothetical protein